MLNATLHFIETIDSTNRYLADMAAGKIANTPKIQDFTVVYTNEQTAGRGMGTNQWHSDYGQNILASFYFEPDIDASQQFCFNRFFALAVRDMLAHHTDAVIKWPNDILVHGQKIAGILIEHSVVGSRLAHSIAGVGININQTSFRKDIPHPTSLKLLTGKHFDVEELLNELISSCQKYYKILKEGKLDILEKEYLQYLYQLDKPASYQYHNEVITATITGIDTYGRLMLQKEDGTILTCGYKEIVFL